MIREKMARALGGLVLFALLLGGCSSHSLERQTQHSLAYNIVAEGNLPTDFASDSVLEGEQEEQLKTLVAWPAAQEGLATKPPAFAQWQALNQVLAASTSASTSTAGTEEVTVLAWVPSYRSDNRAAARKAMIKQIDRAIRQAFAEISAEHSAIENVTIQRMDDVVFQYRSTQQWDGAALVAHWRCASIRLIWSSRLTLCAVVHRRRFIYLAINPKA